MKLLQFWRGVPCSAFILPVFCFLIATSASAQFLYPSGPRVTEQPHNPLLASYALTSVTSVAPDTIPMAFAGSGDANSPGRKSGFLAAALSLVIPGLGEYYVGDHVWRGMIFTGMEAGLWIGMIHCQQQYNSDQNAFYSYSDAHFCVERYANFLDSTLVLDSATPSAHVHSCDWRQISRSDWNLINQAEAELDSLTSNQLNPPDFNHRLINPNDDEQQYNEMISKYDQYIPGWDAISSWSTASFMRANAQHQADIANDFLFGIFLNHVLSAIDAALLARDHNSAIELHGDLIQHPYPDGTMGFIPTANIEYRF